MNSTSGTAQQPAILFSPLTAASASPAPYPGSPRVPGVTEHCGSLAQELYLVGGMVQSPQPGTDPAQSSMGMGENRHEWEGRVQIPKHSLSGTCFHGQLF